MANSSVAVIIPTYNREELVGQAIDSILAQTRPPDQLTVVDDGSTDNTDAVLSAYGDRICRRRQNNSGKPAALNAAMADADADYIWIFDDDDVALPDALERHLNFLEANPGIDFTYSGCYFFDGDAPPEQVDEKNLYDALDAPAPDLFVRWLENFPGHTGGMLVPLACYRNVGFFDSSLTFGEDYDMALRLARRHRGAKLANATFFMRRHARPRGPERERHEAAEREMAWRHYERLMFLRLRRELDLSEYLPRRDTRLTGAEAERRALLQRACVMARHALFPQAFEDLRAATKNIGRFPLSADEIRICSRMLDLEPALLEGQEAWLNNVRRLLSRRSRTLFDSCIAGLGWSIEREWRHGSYSGVLSLLRSLYLIAGFGIVRRMMQRTWDRSLKNYIHMRMAR